MSVPPVRGSMTVFQALSLTIAFALLVIEILEFRQKK
ncbi:hypothetical protein [Companilactobacillus insicii]